MQQSAYAELELDKYSRYYCAWVMPKCSKNLVAYLQHFGVIDEAYCKTRHRFVLLPVTTLDADKKILIFAWALIPQEDHANWM